MLQMKDIWSDVNDEEDADDGGSCTLTDDEKLKLEDEQCQQLQQENDFLRAQIAEAITSIIHDAIFIIQGGPNQTRPLYIFACNKLMHLPKFTIFDTYKLQKPTNIMMPILC